MTGGAGTYSAGRWIAATMARWHLILQILGATITVAAALVLALPPVYLARTSFLTASTGDAIVRASLAEAASSGTGTIANGRSVADYAASPQLYVQLIESEELRRRLLRSRFASPSAAGTKDSATLLSLLDIAGSDARRVEEKALVRLGKSLSANVDGTSNIVEVRARLESAELAAAVANSAVALVHEFDREQRRFRAESRRKFIEARVSSARDELNLREQRSRVFYETNFLWQNSPHLAFEESQLRRNLAATTALFVSLQRQYDAARLDEADNAPAITVIDAAIPPRKADWPRYWLLLANALAVGGLLGVATAGVVSFVAERRRRSMLKPAEVLTTIGPFAEPSGRSFISRVAFPVFAWGLVFHSLVITMLFGLFGFPESTVRTIAGWKEAGLALLIVSIIARATTGRGRKAELAWSDLWVGGLIATAVLFLLIENPWLRLDLPAAAEFLGIRDAVYFMLAYFVGRAAPELVTDDRAMRSLFILIVVTCGIGLVERALVTPEMLVGLGVASYFQNFLGVSAFTVGNDYGLPLNYWTMIGGSLFRRAGSVYLSGQGFAVPFILFFPLATAWVFLRASRSRIQIAAFVVVAIGLVLTLTRMTILVALIQLVLFVWLIRKPEWAVAGVAVAFTIIFVAFVSIPGFPTFVWHTLSWQEGSSISHVNDWMKGISVFTSQPWGSGLGTADQTAVRSGLKHLTGDNLYLKYGVEMGIAGLVFLLLILAAIGGTAMRLFRDGTTWSQKRMGMTLWLAVIGIAINGVTAVVFNSITLGWLFFWLAGAAVSAAQSLPGLNASLARHSHPRGSEGVLAVGA